MRTWIAMPLRYRGSRVARVRQNSHDAERYASGCDSRAYRTMSWGLIVGPASHPSSAPIGVSKIANELDLLRTRRGIMQAASALGMGLAGTGVSGARSAATTNSQPAHELKA